MGLINYAVPTDELDEKVDADGRRKSLANPRWAVRYTKTAVNLVLARYRQPGDGRSDRLRGHHQFATKRPSGSRQRLC